MNNINKLKEMIKEQEEININHFNIFQYRLHEKEMQPIIEEWRKGSKKLKELDEELYNLEKKEKEDSLNTAIIEEKKTFVNSFGEATTREITTITYRRQEKRRQKEIISFLGKR